MKNSFLTSVAALVVCLCAPSLGDVVGRDDRREVRFTAADTMAVARSIALVTTRDRLLFSPKNATVTLAARPLQQEENFCDETRFGRQRQAGHCTASLIGPDMLLVAGHCIDANDGPNDDGCRNVAFVFDFRVGDGGQEKYTAAKRDVYFCRELRRFVTEPAPGKALHDDGGRIDDYAFVTLDRPAEGRLPLRLATSEREEQQLFSARGRTSLAVLHHPYGTFLKDSPVGTAENPREGCNYVRTDADISKGSSGAPIIDVSTRTVLAVVKGVTYPRDYRETTRDVRRGCRNEYRFPEGTRPVIAVRASAGWNRFADVVLAEATHVAEALLPDAGLREVTLARTRTR